MLINTWFRPKSKPEGVNLRPKRREPHDLIPMLSMRIMAELIIFTRAYNGMLWDISTRGAWVQSYQPIAYEPIASGISCIPYMPGRLK